MLQSLKLALKSIWGNKMRSFLTMLGTIIGVAAVVMLVNLVNGYMGNVVKSFVGVGVNQINVNATSLVSRSLGVGQMYAFYEEHIDLFGELSPNVTLPSTIKYGDDPMTSILVTGRNKQYLEIKSYELEAGRNIVYSGIVSRQKVYVIDAYMTNEFYGSAQSAIERTLKIDGYAFKIIDMAKVQDENNMKDGGTDDFVWIPYSVAVKMSRNANINNYTFTTLGTSKADECTTVIRNFLYETFRDEDLYRVAVMSGTLDPPSEQIAMMNGMLGGVAGISLSMTGVGIMSVMLVSVTERTKKIGIRRPLGADRGAIMRQFAIEAAMTSFIGSVIGILVEYVVTTAVEATVGVPAAPTLSAVIISFSVSVGIELLFGYMSASRAVSLNPIDTLRNE